MTASERHDRTSSARIDDFRGHRYLLDGRPVPSVTGILGAAYPKPALASWAAREAASYAVEHYEVLHELPPEDALDVIKRSPYRERDRAAGRGTEVHRLAQAIALGQPVSSVVELLGHVEAYRAWLSLWRPEVIALERPCFSRTHQYAGSFDALCWLDGQVALLDIKTNRSGPFPEAALQLAAYGGAEFYLDDEDQETPMPGVDLYGVVWVRADLAELIRFDVGEDELHTFLRLTELAHWLETRAPYVKREVLRPLDRREQSA